MSRSMKLAFINIYQNLVDRGAETFVKEVSERLSKKHEVKIFSGKKIPPARWPIIWRLFIDPQGLIVAWFTLKLIPRILREKYDVVIPLNGGWQVAIVRIITWLKGSKMVISGQSGIGWDDRNNLWCFPNAFVALSTFAKKWAKMANPFVKVECISNGVDMEKFVSQGEKIKTNLKTPIILCVGALTKTKRIELVIKAVAKLKSVNLLICGDGNLRSRIYDLGSKMLGDRFQLIKVPYEDMSKVYRVADIFTLPSESYYSFEIVLVEAMASGLPVVANDDPIRREIVGDAGILIDPTNTNTYAQTLKKALETNWDGKPREQAKEFDWDKIALEYEKIIRSL